jgi:hypothetical protein
MKNSILLSLLFIAFNLLISCTKDSEPEPTPAPYAGPPLSLQNTWELRILNGGYGPPNRNPNYAPGNGIMWKFMDSTYERYNKGVVHQTGKYMVTKDSSQATGRLMDALLFERNAYPKLHFEIVKDTLIIYMGVIAADGTVEKYVSIGPKKAD